MYKNVQVPLAMISQPSRGVDEKKFLEIRSDAMRALADSGYETLNTTINDEEYDYITRGMDIENKELFRLSMSLKFMSQCDAVYFCTGWDQDTFCKLERACAEAYNIIVIDDI